MSTPHAGSTLARPSGHRLLALVAAVLFAATGTVFWPASRASAAPGPGVPALPSLAGQCSTEQWQDPSQWDTCVGKLQDLTQDEVQCVEAPTPETPDSGMAGWFATRPDAATVPGTQGLLHQLRLRRLRLHHLRHRLHANGHAPGLQVREHRRQRRIHVRHSRRRCARTLYETRPGIPESMWGWADTLVDTATRSIYTKVFTVFGTITLAVVGLYLALAIPAVGHEQCHDDSGLGDPRHGRGDGDRLVASALGTPCRPEPDDRAVRRTRCRRSRGAGHPAKRVRGAPASGAVQGQSEPGAARQ